MKRGRRPARHHRPWPPLRIPLSFDLRRCWRVLQDDLIDHHEICGVSGADFTGDGAEVDDRVGPVLGWVRRDGVRRIRWIRLDPLADFPGILVSIREENLAGDASVLGRLDVPELDPATSLPPDFVARDEAEALLYAKRETGARRNRWVNQTVDGWRLLCALRGHS